MSFQNKPGKTSAWRKMVIRQQVSDVLAYGQIITSVTKAKETRRHVDKMITLAKKNTLAAKREVMRHLLNTKNLTSQEIMRKLFDEIAPKYKNREGGYTSVLKLENQVGDNTQQAILRLV